LHAENKALKARHAELIEGLQKITFENSNCGTYNFIQKLCKKAK